jgi:hypothetical protein
MTADFQALAVGDPYIKNLVLGRLMDRSLLGVMGVLYLGGGKSAKEED